MRIYEQKKLRQALQEVVTTVCVAVRSGFQDAVAPPPGYFSRLVGARPSMWLGAVTQPMLESKAAWSGVMLVNVPPACMSPTGGGCSDSEYAERNAANNMLRRGRELLSPSCSQQSVQSG
jgi:hypothetical protein